MPVRNGDIVLQSVLLVLCVLILILPFFVEQSLISPTQSGKFFLFTYGVLLILLLYLLRRLFSLKKMVSVFANNETRVGMSWLDVVLLIWFVYITARVLSSYDSYGIPSQYFELTGLAVIYCAIRCWNGRNLSALFGAVMVAGTTQAIYGHLQIYGILPSHHHLFKTTGGFFNPGHYAGYMAVIFSIALSLQLFKSAGQKKPEKGIGDHLSKNKMLELISLITIISILSVIPATRSRAAWLALLISGAYLLYVRYHLYNRVTFWLNSRTKKVLFLLASAILVVGSATGMYFMKKGSVDGRMLIWKVSAKMVEDKPIFGHGYDRFKAQYLNYQARYFQGKEKTNEAVNADDTRRAFNEFLELTSEDGIVGLLLITTMIYLIFFSNEAVLREKKSRPLVVTCRAGIVAFAVFACFSYPSEILPMKLNLVVCLAGISTQQRRVHNLLNNFESFNRTLVFLQKSIVVIGVIIVVYSFIPLRKALDSHLIWKEAFVLYQMRAYDESLKKYQQIYPLLRYDGDYLTSYGKACSMAGLHSRAIKILKRAESFFPNSTLSTALGDSYKATGNYRLAEQAYLKAVHMVPDRFYPKYLLAKLYDQSGQAFKAILIANELLQKEPKVRSVAVDEIKKEMQEIVNKSKRSSS